MRFKDFAKKILAPGLTEASYPGNIGFEELVKFYKKANKDMKEEMERSLRKGDWESFKELIQYVVGTRLK